MLLPLVFPLAFVVGKTFQEPVVRVFVCVCVNDRGWDNEYSKYKKDKKSAYTHANNEEWDTHTHTHTHTHAYTHIHT